MKQRQGKKPVIQYVYTPYIVKKGKRIYPKTAKVSEYPLLNLSN